MLNAQFSGSPVNGKPEVSAAGEDQLRLQRFLATLGTGTQQLVARQFEMAAEASEERLPVLPVPLNHTPAIPREKPTPYFKPKRPRIEEERREHEVRLLEQVRVTTKDEAAEWADRALTGLMKVATVKDLNFTRADRRVYLMVYRSVLDEHLEQGLSLSPGLKFVHGFIVQDAVAGALGFSLKTVLRAMLKLEHAGVLATAVKRSGIKREGEEQEMARAEGTVVNVLVRPELVLSGHRVWVRKEHLTRAYRNITEDIQEGRTAFHLLSGIHHRQKKILMKEEEKNGKPNCPRHLQWKEVNQAYPVLRSFLRKIVKGRKKEEEVKTYRTFMFIDLKNLSRKAMTERLKDLAEKLARQLEDQHSVNSYLRIFWRATKLYWQGQDHLFHAQEALEATLKDMKHSKVTKPGALFRHHLAVRGLKCLLT